MLDAARAVLSNVEEDHEGAVAALSGLLERSLCDRCEIELFGELTVRSLAGDAHEPAASAGLAELSGAPDLEGLRRRALASDGVQRWQGDEPRGGACVVVAVRDADTPIGTITCATRSSDDSDVEHDATLEAVARLLGESMGRLLLHRRTRDAVRRSQRIASQLHQLISTSITMAGIRAEADVLDSLADRVRRVFGADAAVVMLASGPGAPLAVAADHRAPRPRPVSASELESLGVPASATASAVPLRDGEWLFAPILVRRGESRGGVCVKRAEAAFSDDDVEVAALLGEMAASALASVELNRSILMSEERLRVLVEAAPVGIVESGLEGRVRWWNRAAQVLFGWPDPDERPDAAPAFPEGVLVPLRELWAVAQQGEVVTGRDLAGVEIDGRRRDLAASVAVLAASTGREGSLLTVVEDVTDHRQLMEELRHAQRMEVIGQLSSSVAHDFNNLLTLIAGYAELLTLESVDTDRARQIARDIQATTTRASTLTGKLLTMGRTKSPAPVVFAPAAAIGAIAEVLDRILGADITLELALEGDGGVRADQDQFEQTVMNLAMNARDAMPEGGVLRIEVSPATLDRDAASRLGVEPGDYLRITVADTGEGMDADTLARCFEPLFTTKGPSKGTGLGLPAARRVVVEAGGSIEVRSEVGHGTTFEILMPFAGTVEPTAEVATEVAAAVEPATVLLAEDEAGIRQLVSRVLRHNGYEVLEAESGEAALELARSAGHLDVLVSDVVMAELRGTELATILQGERPELLVVLVSGNVDATALEGLAEGSAAFLAKPFRPSELIGVLAELRRVRGMAVDAAR